jgi:uncharacterized membrane protein YjgN (DUF898 family)
MHIVCPECGKDHEVAEEKLPVQKFNAICRGCAARFVVEVALCPACGAKKLQGRICGCGEARQAAPAGNGAGPPLPRPEFVQVREEYPLRFTGSGAEYFRIWIVNLLLTIITLGIYAAWAKVRTRHYFYSHTFCGDEPFEYLADPLIILRGNLLVGGGFLLYTLFNAFSPLVSVVIAMLFGLLFPYLVFKSLRFYARNSAYRNIRFHFLGTVEESYITYLLLPFLIPLTLGLILPYWAYRRKKYFFDNVAFGNRRNIFTGIAVDFYKIYCRAFVVAILPVLVVGALVAGMALKGPGSDAMSTGLVVMMAAAYLGFFFATIVAQQYIYAKVTNYCWHYSSLGAVKFRSSLAVGRLLWIRVSNIVALILSAGLLYPWTKVRQSRYILENIMVISYQGLADFTAGEQDAEGALGEAALDFFDFEVGL